MERRTTRLRASALAVILLLIPVVLLVFAAQGIEATLIVSFGMITLVVLALLISFERSRPRPRDIMPIVVLAALAIAGRIIFAALPSFKPVTAIVIVAGVVFGRQAGLMTGMLAALGSNLFFGQGPWTPWQMYAWGLVGYLAGVIFDGGVPAEGRRWKVYLFGVIAALMYGFILDTHFVVGYVRPLTAASAITGYLAGLPWALVHAVSTLVFLLPILGPWGKRLERIRHKYGLSHRPHRKEETCTPGT